MEPYALINGLEGWYVKVFDPAKDDVRHFRLDRIKRVDVLDETYQLRADLDPIADVEGWPRTGQVGGSRIAHVWISPEQARWVARGAHRAGRARRRRRDRRDGPSRATDYLVKEILKEAGDAAVLEPADVREAVLVAAERLCRPLPR